MANNVPVPHSLITAAANFSSIARSEGEGEGVMLHFSRLKTEIKRYEIEVECLDNRVAFSRHHIEKIKQMLE